MKINQLRAKSHYRQAQNCPVFLFLFLIKQITNAQSNTLIEAGSVSDDIVKTLAQKLTQNILTDSLKVIAFYDWITQNIRYDHQFLRREEGDTTLYQEPEQVIVRKKAVCIGYAKLMKALCDTVKIRAVVVEGYIKQNGALQNEAHAWNAVQFGKNWHLLDPTWGATSSFTYKTHLFPTPSVFVENHLPYDPIWQLSNAPISFSCFSEKQNCQTDKKDNFNFKDSINNWLSMPYLEQLGNRGARILALNPDDFNGLQIMADFYGKNAQAFFGKYALMRVELTQKNAPKPTFPP
ncbi:MAG: hypothetical protein HC817_03105 [Saprospiraceae bacterium]|nr:hypothetical protein [Saprospiraceae bacterium]